jgi:hypothetical protein
MIRGSYISVIHPVGMGGDNRWRHHLNRHRSPQLSSYTLSVSIFAAMLDLSEDHNLLNRHCTTRTLGLIRPNQPAINMMKGLRE